MKWHTEVRKISELKEWESNPRTISKEAYEDLKSSIEGLGNFEPLVINTDGTVIAGNQRLRVHKERGDTEVEVSVPERELTDKEIKKIGLISNRHSGEWDMDKLANEFEDVLEELGFDDLMPEVELEVKEDDYKEPEDLETTVVLGDVYQLGEHRLMCGDSTKIEDVEKLMNGEKADMVFTDPPYGMNLDTDYSGMKGWHHGKKYTKIIGDNEDFNDDFINNIFSLFSGVSEKFLFGADYYVDLLPNFGKDGSWFVWDKRVDESKDRMFGSGFELLWSENKHQRRLLRGMWAGFMGDAEASKRVHPTQKPTKILVEIINEYSKGGDKIIDLFGGSGSTLIACEQTNRKCYMIELDPYYCQVIIDRWERFTGKEAIKLED